MMSPEMRKLALLIRKNVIKYNGKSPKGKNHQKKWDEYLQTVITFLVIERYVDNEKIAKSFLGLPPYWKKGA